MVRVISVDAFGFVYELNLGPYNLRRRRYNWDYIKFWSTESDSETSGESLVLHMGRFRSLSIPVVDWNRGFIGDVMMMVPWRPSWEMRYARILRLVPFIVMLPFIVLAVLYVIRHPR